MKSALVDEGKKYKDLAQVFSDGLLRPCPH